MTFLLWAREVALSVHSRGSPGRGPGSGEAATRGLEYVPAIALNLLLFSVVLLFE